MQFYQLETVLKLQRYLAQQYLLYQVISNANGESCWQQVNSGNDAPLIESPPLSSPKGLFFSERENIFSFDGEYFRETLPKPSPFCLFSVQSCDLTAIAYQDQFFAEDPYYQARRQQALLVGNDCLTPCETGFCNTVDAGPGVDAACADLILHRQNNGQYLLLVCSDKGQQALLGLKLNPATSADLQQRQNNIDRCKQQFDSNDLVQKGINTIVEQQLPKKFWQQIGLQCLSCSGCTSLCPTCSCYGNRDLIDDQNTIHEQRFWDSCLYESFQREASQHNPSQEAGERVHRFWSHKFSKETFEQFGRYGCVGCGRCEQTCPGVIGALSLMDRIVTRCEDSTNKTGQIP